MVDSSNRRKVREAGSSEGRFMCRWNMLSDITLGGDCLDEFYVARDSDGEAGAEWVPRGGLRRGRGSRRFRIYDGRRDGRRLSPSGGKYRYLDRPQCHKILRRYRMLLGIVHF